MMLIVTRPRLDAASLQRKLAARGHEVRLSPLLNIVDVPGVSIPRADYQAVLISSANGARALARHEARARLIGLPAFTVGPQSAAAAREAGFRKVTPAGGNVVALIERVGEMLSSGDGPLLYLSGEETTGDIAGALGARGFTIDRAVLYAAQPAVHITTAAVRALRAGTAGGVLLYSPRSARIWAKCIAADNLVPYMETLLHFCLSPPVAEVLPGEWQTITAKTADEDAMLERIDGVARAAARKV